MEVRSSWPEARERAGASMSRETSSQSSSAGDESSSGIDDLSASSDSELESAGGPGNIPARRRPKWQLVWSSIDTTRDFASVEESLPSFVRKKNDQYRCTMHHASRDPSNASRGSHTMRTILTKCTSTRCGSQETECTCRYKINVCEDSDLVDIFQEGNHEMRDENASSPREPMMTTEMKAFVSNALSSNSSITSHVLFTGICTKVQEGVFSGVPPLEKQVQGYVKRWRAKNRDDSMQPVIDICSGSMFELVRDIAQTGDEFIVFCDSQNENGSLVPDIGDASDESPLRMGLTSYSLLEAYVNVQQDPRCATILHLDSTHNTVRQRYSVFILGISDSCGQFFPLVYYCASQRRAEDVAWCLSYVKRVMLSAFAVRFSPQFVMTDADNAQYNACMEELPTTKVLMCWFHVCQNVWKKTRKLPKHERDIFFRDLNDLHFCRSQDEFESKLAVVKTNRQIAASESARFRSAMKKISKQWIDNPRFSKWQAFHTPPGYPTNNNPVEQYHRTVKLVNNTSRATPIEMVELLNQSRIGFLAKKTQFASITKVSKRLKAHYNRIKKRGELTATQLQPVGDMRHQLVQEKHEVRRLAAQIASQQPVHHEQIVYSVAGEQLLLQHNGPLQSISDSPRTNNLAASRRTSRKKKGKQCEFYADDVNQPIKSSHTLRMQLEGMPDQGWIVDATSRACQCRFHAKYNVCPHIIEATKVSGLPCPGLPKPVRRFVTRDKRSRARTAQQHISTSGQPRQRFSQNSTDTRPAGYEESIFQSLVLSQGNRPCTTTSEITAATSQPAHNDGPLSRHSDNLVPLRVRCPPRSAFADTLAQTIGSSSDLAMIPDTSRPNDTTSSRQHASVVEMPGELQGENRSSTCRESCSDTKRRRC